MTETVPQRMERRNKEREARKAARDKERERIKQDRIIAVNERFSKHIRKPLAEATEAELLAELLLRRGVDRVQAAPSRINLAEGHSIMCVGIGKDHHADIIIYADDLKELNSHVVQ